MRSPKSNPKASGERRHGLPVVTFHLGERLMQLGRHPKLENWLWDSECQRQSCGRVVFFMFKLAIDEPHDSFFEEAKHSAPDLVSARAMLDAYDRYCGGNAARCAGVEIVRRALDRDGSFNRPPLQVIAESRGITRLVHFTSLGNIASILEHGVLSRRTIQERGIESLCNDALRLDGDLDGISLSIEWHNYKMLYSLCGGQFSSWALLNIKPEVLWTQECRFHSKNAASREIGRNPTHSRTGARAFEELYGNVEGWPVRSSAITRAMPTNPQAEVMCHAPLPIESISSVVLHQPAPELQRKLLAANVPYRLDPRSFGPRIDYASW